MDANSKAAITIPGLSQPLNVSGAGQQQGGNFSIDSLMSLIRPQQQPQQQFQINPQQAQQFLAALSQGRPLPGGVMQGQVQMIPSAPLPTVDGQSCLSANGHLVKKVKSPYVSEFRLKENLAVAAGAGIFAAIITALGFGTEATRKFAVYQGVRSAEIDNRFIYAVQPVFEAVVKDAAGFIDERMSNIVTRALYRAFTLAGYHGADDQYLFLSRVECADLRDNALLLSPYQVTQWTSTQHCFRLDQSGVGRNVNNSDLALPGTTAEGATEVSVYVGLKTWWEDTREMAEAKAARGVWNPYRQEFVI